MRCSGSVKGRHCTLLARFADTTSDRSALRTRWCSIQPSEEGRSAGAAFTRGKLLPQASSQRSPPPKSRSLSASDPVFLLATVDGCGEDFDCATACARSDNYMSARSEHLRELAHKYAIKAAAAKNPMTKTSSEQERKQLLALAEEAERAERNRMALPLRGLTKR
jgi:hypothetical protein